MTDPSEQNVSPRPISQADHFRSADATHVFKHGLVGIVTVTWLAAAVTVVGWLIAVGVSLVY